MLVAFLYLALLSQTILYYLKCYAHSIKKVFQGFIHMAYVVLSWVSLGDSLSDERPVVQLTWKFYRE